MGNRLKPQGELKFKYNPCISSSWCAYPKLVDVCDLNTTLVSVQASYDATNILFVSNLNTTLVSVQGNSLDFGVPKYPDLNTTLVSVQVFG